MSQAILNLIASLEKRLNEQDEKIAALQAAVALLSQRTLTVKKNG